MTVELIKTFIEYHLDMTRHVWDSIDEITEEQFLVDDAYSRGSIRNLMVHLASTDRRWLTGLKNLPDVGHLKFEDFPTRSAARALFDTVAGDFAEYLAKMTGEELHHLPPEPERWAGGGHRRARRALRQTALGGRQDPGVPLPGLRRGPPRAEVRD